MRVRFFDYAQIEVDTNDFTWSDAHQHMLVGHKKDDPAVEAWLQFDISFKDKVDSSGQKLSSAFREGPGKCVRSLRGKDVEINVLPRPISDREEFRVMNCMAIYEIKYEKEIEEEKRKRLEARDAAREKEAGLFKDNDTSSRPVRHNEKRKATSDLQTEPAPKRKTALPHKLLPKMTTEEHEEFAALIARIQSRAEQDLED